MRPRVPEQSVIPGALSVGIFASANKFMGIDGVAGLTTPASYNRERGFPSELVEPTVARQID
jgi:hypothetical protein